MEHYPQAEPMKGHKRFSFEAFDALIAEALDDLPAPTPATDPQPTSLTAPPAEHGFDINGDYR